MNYSPNELFLGIIREASSDLLLDHTFLAIADKLELRQPRDPQKVLNECYTLSSIIEERCSRVFSYVDLLRTRDNEKYNQKVKTVILPQFNVGGWVLVSTKGTHRYKRKQKLV